MKKISIVLFIVFCFMGNICVYADDIPYSAERTGYSKINDCAYNGNTYVIVGTTGYIGISSDLQSWTEVKNICYTDINNIIWDGADFVFISGGNVYKSIDGINWNSQECQFITGEDFQCIDGKYLVRKSESDSPADIMKAKVGFTTDFNNFEEINFGQVLDSSKLLYSFSPMVYYLNGIYFAQGLMPDIMYSSNLTDWNILPELPNKNNTNKKYLLFANVGNEYIIYCDENNSVIAYSLSITDSPIWEKHELNMSAMLGDKVMQQTANGIYCFAPFNKAFCSNNGYSFESIDFNTDGNFVKNRYIPLKIQDNNSYSLTDNRETIRSGEIQRINTDNSTEGLWTGQEYLSIDYDKNQVMKTLDKVNYDIADVTVDSLKAIIEKGINVWMRNGNSYIARVGGYESPKLRGGALENGRTLFLFDSNFNLIEKHIFDGDVCDMSYCNNRYYAKIGSLTNKEEYDIYSSPDFEEWNIESELGETPVTNGSTVLLPTYNRENTTDATYTSKDVVDNLKIEMQSVYIPIKYETKTKNKIYVCNGIYAAKMIANDGVYIGFSLDGVYFSKVKLSDDFLKLSERITNNDKAVFYIDGNYIVYEEYGIKISFDIHDINASFDLSPAAYVKVGEEILGFDTPPVIESDRTLVPLRFIFETLGADVDWEDASGTAIVKNEEATILFSIDDTTVSVNNVTKTMDVPARLINDKTMVPLRFLSEELGFNVEWNENTRTAAISK